MKLLKKRPALAVILILTILGIAASACTRSTAPAPAAQQISTQGQPTISSPIVIDRQAGEIRIAARVNGKAFTDPTWHAVVWEKGKFAKLAVFQSLVSPNVIYDSLKDFGGEPGNNLPMKDYGSMYIKGSNVDVSVTWAGAPKTYSLTEVVKDPDGQNGKGIQSKFGGNFERIETAGTGCETCLYSCPVGITSNSVYNGEDFIRHGKGGQAGFLGNKDILPPAGKDVIIIYKMKG